MNKNYKKVDLFRGYGLLASLLLVLFCCVSQVHAQQAVIDFGKAEAGIRIEEEFIHKLRISFSYPYISTYGIESSKGQFNELIIPGTHWIGELGLPKLPASKKLLEVPFGAEVSVQVLNYKVNEYRLADHGITNKIMPAQPSLRKDQNIDEAPFEFNESFYEKDVFFGDDIATIEIIGNMRGFRIARLTVAPVSYNPAAGVIRVFNDIEIEISFSDFDVENNRQIKAATWSPYFEPIGNFFINRLQGVYPDHSGLAGLPVKYLVVSDRMFEHDLEPFINWKTRKGFEMIVAFTDEIGNSFSAIQSWVHTQYNAATPQNPAPSFLLLVGDTPQIPAPAGSVTGKVTDLYYASVDGDFFPEMYYGRFSATNSAELIAQIEKTLYYEQYQFADPSFLDKTTLIAGADSYWNPRVGQPTITYGVNNYFNASRGYTDIYTYLTSPYAGCYNPEKIAVGFINYTAHCNQTMWGSPALTQIMVKGFSNQGQYPLAIGNCCLAADFGHPESIGETWMRAADKGAVVYIGSAPNSFWFEDFYWSVGAFPIQGNNSNGYVPTYTETTLGAYDAPFMSDYVSAGGLVAAGNLAVTEAHIQSYPGHSSPEYYWQAYNVLGDPSLVIYHTQGSTNTISHLPVLTVGLQSFTVEADPGSYVAISKDDFLLGVALVDSSGVAEVSIEPVLSAGMVDIVVTKPQYIPYQVQIPAEITEGPYIVVDGFAIKDHTGNNNGLADYGENISIDLSLKNVGAEPSGAITITIGGNDDFVSISGSSTNHAGPVNSWETLELADAFSFSIADYVPDQHQAVFSLEITDGSNTWNSSLTILVQAPLISISQDFLINDSQTGNNDGILDPGETAMIVLNISNTGHSNISGLTISAISNDPGLLVNTAVVMISDLPSGEVAEIGFFITANEFLPDGYPVNLEFIAEGGPQHLYACSQIATIVIGLVPEYTIANQTIATCYAMFYDSGGQNGHYGNNENLTMTFTPANPDAMMRVKFLAFQTELVYDKLYVFNGADINAPEFPGSPFHGNTNPGTLTASNPAGAITFRFVSDGYVTAEGWEAVVFCHIPSEPPVCAWEPFPPDGAADVNTNFELSWASADATKFDVYFGSSINPPLFTTINTNGFLPELIPNTTYFWKIVPKNAAGPAAGCSVWSFTTGEPVYLMSDNSHAVIRGMFYDSGGPQANYENNEDYVITFIPFAEGYQLEFTILHFETEHQNDLFYVFDGPDVDAPQITGSPFHGSTIPEIITSSHGSGALTFRFISNSQNTYPGWAASFRSTGGLAVFPTSHPLSLCEGNSVQLYANAIGGTGDYTYSWEPAGGLNNPAAENPIASPAANTLYTITVNDGENSVSGSHHLVVNPLPLIDIGNDTILCLNSMIILDASIPDGISYYWMPGGETTPAITVGSNGEGPGKRLVTVMVTDINGCIGEASVIITFDACTYVADESEQLNILVFPNPARSLLNISITGDTDDLSFSLLNHHGQVVYSYGKGGVSGNLTHQINTERFARGLYFLRLQTRNNVFTKKVLLQ